MASGKRTLFATGLAILVVATIELALRGWFAFMLGPSLFFYGTSYHRLSIAGPVERSPLIRTVFQRRLRGGRDEYHNVRQHDFAVGNYTKYYPHEARTTYDVDTGAPLQVTINSRGFRGVDPEEPKAPGTLRVVALGASSTFGYHNADETTYPSLLERLLNERCMDGHRYEVINLGIPHLDSGQIASLFLHEGVPLQPDIVTFYEGINDSTIESELGAPKDPSERSLPSHVRRWVREHFLSAYLFHEISSSRKDEVRGEAIEALLKERPVRFVENLERLRAECEERGILFLVGRQQARSLLVPREEIKGVTYAEEVARVRDKLARKGSLTKQESALLVHERLLAAEVDWAHQKNVAVVDILRALDRERDVLVSWVHLSPRGNAMIAETWAEEILDRTCRGVDGARSRQRA